MLVPNWREVLKKSLAVWAAYFGIALSYADTLYAWAQSSDTAWMDPQLKTWVLRICFALVILGRIKKQAAISGETPPPHPLTKD